MSGAVGHVFIVGLPRTGTNLTRNILNRSALVGIGGESHFFSVRRRLGLSLRRGMADRIAARGSLHDDAAVESAVDAVYERSGPNFWGRLTATVDRETFQAAILAGDRSPKSVLDLAMAHHAGGKPIRGEKTPAHIYAVPTLLAWYPDGRVIHTTRDPRAVYASNKRKYEQRNLPALSRAVRRLGLLFELYSSLDLILEWRRVMALDRLYRRRYPDRYTVLRFEDLVREPRREIERLCGFVGIDFEEGMLTQAVTNSSFMRRGATEGFDSRVLDRWREHVHPVVVAWFELWAGRLMRAQGYGR